MVISRAWIINHLLACSVDPVGEKSSLTLTDHPPLRPKKVLCAWRSLLGEEGPALCTWGPGLAGGAVTSGGAGGQRAIVCSEGQLGRNC